MATPSPANASLYHLARRDERGVVMDFDPAEIAYVPTTGCGGRMRRRLSPPATRVSKGTAALSASRGVFLSRSSGRRPRSGARSIRIRAIRAASRRAIRILVERRDPLCPQQRCRRQLSLRLEQLAGRGGERGTGQSASTRADLAGQLSPRWRPAVLSIARPELCRAAGAARG